MAEVRRLPNKGAENVIAGWLGCPLPLPVKHRNKSRAAYRKTGRKVVVPVRRAA
jgi:hypothetical protein